MTDLIACIDSEKGKTAHVDKVINGMEWDKVYLIMDEVNIDAYNNKKCEKIGINENKTINEIKEQIINKLKGKINDLEVGVNLVAGSGKMHMALIAALIRLGLGMRLIVLTKEGVKEI